MLLEKGADVNLTGGYFDHALVVVAFEGHGKVVELLLDYRADINAKGCIYGNAIEAAANRGHDQVVKLLLERGADIAEDGGNPLQAAGSRGRLGYGIVLDDPDYEEKLVGGFQGHFKVVELLLEYGVDANFRGGSFGNALIAAVYGGDNRIVEFVLEQGVDFNAPQTGGETAL